MPAENITSFLGSLGLQRDGSYSCHYKANTWKENLQEESEAKGNSGLIHRPEDPEIS